MGGPSELKYTNPLVPVLLVAILLSAICVAQSPDKKALKDILSKQGFSGVLYGNDKITFTCLGSLQCNAENLSVYYYTWEEVNPPGRAVHFIQRLIFLKGRDYVGQYEVSDRPVLIKPDLLRFPVSEEGGNSLSCGQKGLPKSLLLDGEDRDLFR